MLSLFRALMPKEDKFFDFFEQHADTLVEGARGLQELLEGGPAVDKGAAVIALFEDKADQITREALLAVRRTFITPFDRSAIQDLVGALDDTIDQMHKTAKTAQLYGISVFEPAMHEMGDVIAQAAAITQETIPLLRSIGTNAARINDLTEKVIQLEGRADDMHNKGLKALYLASHDKPMSFIVGAEVYDHLEKVMDRFEDVANRISGIVVEHL